MPFSGMQKILLTVSNMTQLFVTIFKMAIYLFETSFNFLEFSLIARGKSFSGC